MKNTYCQKCIFSKEVSSDKSCEFNIPNIIKNNKDISVIDNFYVINDYTCLYGFGKQQYEFNKEELKNIQIKDAIKEKTDLKYYLLLDARELSYNDLNKLIDIINNFNIKAKKISILVNPQDADIFYQYISNNLVCAKWTIHIFINNISFNDCLNIVLDTNLQNCNAWCIIFYDASKYNTNKNTKLNLDNIIDILHQKIILKQESMFGIIEDPNSLHGLCLNCSLYKFVTSTVSNDILKGLLLEPNISLGTYETK